jgi:hypothetical protein
LPGALIGYLDSRLPKEGIDKMAYDPRTDASTNRDRDVIVTPPGPNYGGIALATVLVLVAILFAVWFFNNDGTGTTGTTAPPVETTLPAETTVPTDTTPTTTAP